MQHGMAIWAYGNEIPFQVNNIVCSNLLNGNNMVNMDKILSYVTINIFKIHTALFTYISL